MIRITVRGLESLLAAVPIAEKALGKDEFMTVTSHSVDGQILADATVIAMPAGLSAGHLLSDRLGQRRPELRRGGRDRTIAETATATISAAK